MELLQDNRDYKLFVEGAHLLLGEGGRADITVHEDGKYQCFSERFENDSELACFFDGLGEKSVKWCGGDNKQFTFSKEENGDDEFLVRISGVGVDDLACEIESFFSNFDIV